MEVRAGSWFRKKCSHEKSYSALHMVYSIKTKASEKFNELVCMKALMKGSIWFSYCFKYEKVEYVEVVNA